MHSYADALYERVCEDLSVRNLGALTGFWASSEFTPLEVASHLLQTNLLSKYCVGQEKQADDAALQKFLQVNSSCRDWELVVNDAREEELVGEIRKELYDFFYPRGEPLIHSLHDLLDHGRLGPGASIGAGGGDFYTKFFSSKLSTTSEHLYKTYRHHIEGHPTWLDAEKQRTASYGEPTLVDASRLAFVPKKAEISRVIFVEPTLNMFYQLGLEAILRKRLKQVYDLDLSTQQLKNRVMARKGSITPDDSRYDETFNLVTIDLSSASDSISLNMLRKFLPAHVLCWFELLRTKNVKLPSGELVETHMVSTMGNGYTFPLQTVLFTAICVACARWRGSQTKLGGREVTLGRSYLVKAASGELDLLMRRRNGRERETGCLLTPFGVNGDDIIVHRHFASDVLRCLKLLGFKVNSDKTFIEGCFRESCGGDYFKGNPVRPVYVKKLETPQDRISVINALTRWSVVHNVMLVKALRYLWSTLRPAERLYVPMQENDECGIRVPLSVAKTAQKSLYCLSTGSLLYKRFQPVPLRLTFNESGVCTPRGLKRRIYNPSGLLISMLNGVVKSGAIAVRNDRGLYRPKVATTPWWDWLTPDPTAAPWLAEVPHCEAQYRLRWETVAELAFLS